MTWLSGKKVDAIWSNEEESNVHGNIDGTWLKFQDDNSDACTNFAILASLAKDGNRYVDVNVDNGRITEIYVW